VGILVQTQNVPANGQASLALGWQPTGYVVGLGGFNLCFAGGGANTLETIQIVLSDGGFSDGNVDVTITATLSDGANHTIDPTSSVDLVIVGWRRRPLPRPSATSPVNWRPTPPTAIAGTASSAPRRSPAR
jgi:hypothetical protein